MEPKRDRSVKIIIIIIIIRIKKQRKITTNVQLPGIPERK
jgi:hypothetical protein